MARHVLVFVYIFGIFLGMTGIFLYWLVAKKTLLKNALGCVQLRKFMISTFLVGLISFFTFYSQFIIFLKPALTTYRILDYLFWVCFLFYWIDYLDFMVGGNSLYPIKKIFKYGCLVYLVLWAFTAFQIWDIDFTIMSVSSRILFAMLDIFFCLLSLTVVILYLNRGRNHIKNRLSGFYIFSVSTALIAYAIWEFLHYIKLFTGLSAPKPWVLDPFDATAFFLFFTNLLTLFYVYRTDFAAYFLNESSDSGAKNSAPDVLTEYFAAKKEAEDFAEEHNLTPREKEVMEFVYKGFNNAEIAHELYISQNTVKHHVYNLFRKLKVSSRVELICLLQDYYS